MTTTNIMLGKVVYGGQDPSDGVTYGLTGTTAAGDLVAADTATAGSAKRGAAGTLPLGLLTNIEGDNRGRVQSLHKVTAVKITGTIILGPAGLQCAGDGTGQLVAAGTASSLLVNVIGSQAKDGGTVAALHRL